VTTIRYPAVVGPRARLDATLTPTAYAWLELALSEAAGAGGPTRGLTGWELRFAEAGRRCGEDGAVLARVLLLLAVRADSATVTRLYRQGTAAERLAVLSALPHLRLDAAAGLPLVEDALRTHDTRLVAAAVGPYAAAHLDPHAWRHAVLKCLFTQVPVAAVADLDRRAGGDAELGRMLTAYAAERRAAGRAVPADLYHVLALTEQPAEPAAGTEPREP
jgi:hypothetical protein